MNYYTCYLCNIVYQLLHVSSHSELTTIPQGEAEAGGGSDHLASELDLSLDFLTASISALYATKLPLCTKFE